MTSSSDTSNQSLPGLNAVEESTWHELASAAGGTGRFLMDLESGMAQVDTTLRRLTGLMHLTGPFPAAEFFDHIHAEDRAGVGAAIEEARQTGAPYEATFRFQRPEAETIWLTATGRKLTLANGSDVLVGTNHDVTALRNAQEQAELLAGEMSHRIKNIFTLTQSMFNMAARGATTKEELTEAFSGRLRALSAVNGLTFSHPDRKVALSDVLDTVLGPLVAEGRVSLSLPDQFDMNGTASQTFVLALNELMTNAVKHGALKSPGGTVSAGVEITDTDFILTWAETTTEPVTPPSGRTGFGMRVLTSMTAATYAGQPEFDWRADGLTFRCTWPRDRFAWQGAPKYSPDSEDRVTRAAHLSS